MATTVSQSKTELVHAIETACSKLLDDYCSIPAELTRKLELPGNSKGSLISVCDSVAYLIGWGRLVLKWHRLKSAGEPMDFPETGYKWNQLGDLAAAFHSQYQEWAYPDLLAELEATTEQILALIDSLDDQQLYQVTWYEKHTLGRMIQLNTASPMKSTRTKVRRFKKSYGL